MCKCCGQENKGPEKEVCLFVTCTKSLLECGHDKALVTTMRVTLEQAKEDFPTENFCEDWELHENCAICYFCKKVVSAEMDYCYGCGEHVCCDCDETDVYGRHDVEDHRYDSWGKLLQRVRLRNRYDGELSLKTNLHLFNEDWERLDRLIERANNDFPIFRPDVLDFCCDAAYIAHLVDYAKEVEKWRKTWLGKR